MDYNQNEKGSEWPDGHYQQPGGTPPYPPYPSQYPPANQQVVLREVGQQKENKLAITSLVLGIVTLIFFWVPFITVFTGIAGMVMSIVSLVKEDGKVMPIIGLVLCILGLAGSSLVILAYVIELSGYAY